MVPAVASTSIGPAVSQVPTVIGEATAEVATERASAGARTEITVLHLSENPARQATESTNRAIVSLAIREDNNINFSICGRHGCRLRRTKTHGERGTKRWIR